jgi:hypothetical protein
MRVENHEDSSPPRADRAKRFLEDPDGVAWLLSDGRRIGRVRGEITTSVDIDWVHEVALLLLQGASIPYVTGGLSLVAGAHRPPWHPRPGIDGAVFSNIS